MRPISALTMTALALLAAADSCADEALPKMLIRVPESISTLFVAETSTSSFYRFDRVGDHIVKSGSYYMSIGQNGAGKERSGDRRTPIGAYFVTEQLDTSRMHEKYGVTAFPLDYPNEWDRRADRDGDGIWLHGVLPGGGKRPPRDTDGCIALPNDDLAALIPAFTANQTPVLVTREVTWVDGAERESLRVELESRVAEWAASKKSGDLYSYLSLYDDDYTRWGLNKDEWSALVLRADSAEEPVSAMVSELLLVAYPEEEGVYLSRFRLTITREEQQTVAMARLYWRRDEHGAFRIIAENRG
jgi:murein L,D-transpeptidase YafK